MARSLTAGVQSALANELGSGELALLIELQFGTGTVRLTTAPQNLVWGGQTWTAVGGLLGYSDLTESPDLSANGIELQLSGVDQGILAYLLTDTYIGRPATLWLIHMPTIAGFGVPVGGSCPVAIQINQDASGVNNGEIFYGASGFTFTHPNGTTYSVPANTVTLTAMDLLAQPLEEYLMFVGSDTSRFFIGTPSNRQIVAVQYRNGWFYDNNNDVSSPFTPNANDCIIGKIVSVGAGPIIALTRYDITTPIALFSGFMNGGWDVEEERPTDGQPGTVKITGRLTDRMSGLDQRRGIQSNVGSHQALYPGDRFFEFVGQLAGQNLVWKK